MEIYERHTTEYDGDRSRSLQEKAWLDRFLSLVAPMGTVLDVGCGMAEPIAKYMIDTGFTVVGIDSSRSMIEMSRARYPEFEWIVGDMRELSIPRRFDGVLAWDSFFHLSRADQRAMFPRFAAHLAPGAPLMFTSGPSEGEVVGSYCGEPLYHASLDPEEYRQLLVANGFRVRDFLAEDPGCGGHTVWLAIRHPAATDRL